MKILLVAAMPSESEDIISTFGMTLKNKLANFCPIYRTRKNEKNIYLLQTHVGLINASVATALAIQEIKPDAVIKVGCIGGNAPGLKKNDIIVPLSFFHSGAWITKSYISGKPTSDSSEWQSLYGDEPYQNNKDNLGGLDYSYSPDENLTDTYKNVLENQAQRYVEAHLGSGDMVIFDHKFMDNIRQNILKSTNPNIKWCTDNESYAIAQVCKVFGVPFTGIYFIASSDYEDIDGYNPDAIRNQMQQTILPVIKQFIDKI